MPHVQICFDSTYAFGMGASLYMPNTNHALVTIASGLCELLRASTSITWLHEPSHEGLPFNEFADVGAKWQRTRLPGAHSLQSPATMWFDSDISQASWAFLFASSPEVRSSYPVKFVRCDLYLSPTVCPVSTLQANSEVIMDHIDNFMQDDTIEDADMIACRLRFMQFNPKTLLKLIKRECFRRQLSSAHVFWAGFQETRVRLTELLCLETTSWFPRQRMNMDQGGL